MNSKPNSVDQRGDIIEALRKHPEGLTLRDIAEIVGHHRHTITKYVYELIGARVIYQREVGAAKLCYLRESYNGDMKKEGKVAPGKIGKGQAQMIALFMILLLVPATVIVAQNMTNSTSGLEGMSTAIYFPTEDTQDNVSQNISEGIQQGYVSSDESLDAENNVTVGSGGNETAMIPENETASSTQANDTIEEIAYEETENATEANKTGPSEPDAAINASGQATNVTENGSLEELMPPSVNLTINDTLGNITVPEENATITNETNVTRPEENKTEESITTEPEETIEPGISLETFYPESITRGEKFVISAVIENNGIDVAENMVVEWVLPDYFEVLEGDTIEEIVILDRGSSFISGLMVLSGQDASLGDAEIKVRVSYE